MTTHSSILAWRFPMDRGAWWPTVHGVCRVWHNWVTKHSTYYLMITIAQWRECGCPSLFHKWENKDSENLCKKGFQNRIPKCGILCHLMLPLHDLKINMLMIHMCICMYTHMCTHICIHTHTYDICIISNIYCCWIIRSVTFRRLYKRSSFSSSNICLSWRPSLEINRRSNFKFPMLELRILNNDLEIWISTFPREEVAKWHSLLLSANPISWKFNLQWILGATYGKNTD